MWEPRSTLKCFIVLILDSWTILYGKLIEHVQFYLYCQAPVLIQRGSALILFENSTVVIY
jgi:hypothetical protein